MSPSLESQPLSFQSGTPVSPVCKGAPTLMEDQHLDFAETLQNDALASGTDRRVALVQQLFRTSPQMEASHKTEADAAVLPKLLSRLSFSAWSKPSKPNLDQGSLRNEINQLLQQKSAAAELLEEVEQEAVHIEQQLQEKVQQAKQARRKQGNRGLLGFSGFSCATCGSPADGNEIVIESISSVKDGPLDLRPHLRQQVLELEQALTEQEGERRQLQHELQTLRLEKDAVSEVEKQCEVAFSKRPGNARERLLNRSMACFARSDAQQTYVVFLAWRQHSRQRANLQRSLKRSCLSMADGIASGTMRATFSSWRSLVASSLEIRRHAAEGRRRAMAESYSAKFLAHADSVALRAALISWWRLTKEAALEARLEAARETQTQPLKATPPSFLAPEPAPASGKACCSIM